jgi:hypothetical protein
LCLFFNYRGVVSLMSSHTASFHQPIHIHISDNDDLGSKEY